MVLTVEEGKARRLEGLRKANAEMSAADTVHRALVNGRPPVSEFRTPLAAVTAARTLYKNLELRLKAEGLTPAPDDIVVSVGYVTPDLSTVGYTPFAETGRDAAIMELLTGNIALGLIFGIVDRESLTEKRILVGARPFLPSKQTDGWLSELLLPVQGEIEMVVPK